ncbi:MAG: CDGSH iron-sulfur domain-containing protein [Candidatus Eisenbacteria bacterium]|nr:CDGSH iron-sulfur domain-containing protein [Candidatus Eisenbacteria bacterium]
MAEPKIPFKKPINMKLEPGEYYWCACGRSSKQPFCDGSHKGTEFTPLRFEVKEAKWMNLCRCKHTGTPPICDDTHEDLE